MRKRRTVFRMWAAACQYLLRCELGNFVVIVVFLIVTGLRDTLMGVGIAARMELVEAIVTF